MIWETIQDTLSHFKNAPLINTLILDIYKKNSIQFKTTDKYLCINYAKMVPVEIQAKMLSDAKMWYPSFLF